VRASLPARLLLALLLLLGVLDLLRPDFGDALRPWQWSLGALTVFALWRWLETRGWLFREALPVLALAVFLLPTYVDHSRSIESDGVHYYAHLRSLLFDFDLDTSNDYRLLGHPQRGPDVLPVGAAILWAPLVLVVHIAFQAARLFGAPVPTGAEPAYQAAVCLSTLAYGGAGLFLLQDALRRFAGRSAAFWATVLVWVGSPLRFYLYVLPSLAHGAEFFAAVLVLRAYLALRERPTTRAVVRAGLACGLLFLVRSQDGLLLLLPGIELAWRFARGPDRVLWLKRSALLAGVFVLAALPQLAVWQATFGRPFLIPHERIHGADFLHLDKPQLVGTLIGPEGGLFASYPILFAAALGLLVLLLRDPRYVVAVAPVLVLTWYVNATVFDWYQVRRFTGIVPLLAPALAVVLTPLARAGVLVMALVAFFALRYDQAVDVLRHEPGEPVPVRSAVARVADDVVRDGYRLLEPRAPRAAVALLSSYTGEPILADGVTRLDLSRDLPALQFPYLARGLSPVTVEDGVPARWVTGKECRLFLPIADPTGVIVTIRARPLETPEPQVMDILWNGVPVGEQVMTSSWEDYRFHVAASSVRPGTNEVVLRFGLSPIYRRARGEGPREIRAAAIAAVTLHREAERLSDGDAVDSGMAFQDITAGRQGP
jgi:hypothetical protein